MAEPTQFMFTYKDLAAGMVKELGITEGIWGIIVRFGITASNVGPTKDELRPAAIIPIMEFGLQRMDEENNLSVDAEKAWAGEYMTSSPKPPGRRGTRVTTATSQVEATVNRSPKKSGRSRRTPVVDQREQV